MSYFVIHPNGSKYGPATLSVLQQWIEQNRITEETLIQEEDTGEPVRACLVPGLTFGPKAADPSSAPPVQPAPFQSGPYPAGSGYPRFGNDTHRVEADNHLVKAILVTLFCCVPIGVVAIVFAAQVDGHARRGDAASASDCSNKADLWANWSIGLGLAPMLIWFIFMLIAVSSGVSHR